MFIIKALSGELIYCEDNLTVVGSRIRLGERVR